MKNKTKRILAGLGFGLVGAMTLTGCAMSDEQQAALDKVVNKADQIVALVEKQNKQLSKQNAYEMIVLSNNAFKLGLLEQVQIKVGGTDYDGYFEKKEADQPCDQRLKYKLKDGVKFYECTNYEEEGEWTLSVVADYNNDIYHYWNTDNESMELEYDDTTDFTIGGDLLDFIDFSDCTQEDIYDITEQEDGSYKFTCFLEYEAAGGNYFYTQRFDIVVKDNLVQKAEKYSLCERTSDNEITSSYCYAEFEYDNVDFSTLEAKYKQLTNNN